MSDTNTAENLQRSLASRNITVLGRRTSIRLEPEMWNSLRDIAKREKCKIHDICSLVYLRKSQLTSLTAAIRVFIMLYYRAAATEDGHLRAGHGRFENMMRRARIMIDASFDKMKKVSFANMSEKHLKKMDNDAELLEQPEMYIEAQPKLNHFAVYSG